VAFERRSLPPLGEAKPPEGPATIVESNEHPVGSVGRTLAFLIDDLGIQPLVMTQVSKALSRWLEKGADPRDEVTLTTTSGDGWWSATVGKGRGDLESVLTRLKGKKKVASTFESMTDYEAYSIDTYGSPSGGGDSVLDRVVNRWLLTRACVSSYSPDAGTATCRGLVRARAQEQYGAATRRAAALLGGVERLSLGLAGSRGRKSIIVLSEGLLRDLQQSAFDSAADASRRGNTAVSFVDARGLVGMWFYGADQPTQAVPPSTEVGVMTMETAIFETAGGESLADATGGTIVRGTNDLAGAVERLADESSSYYLLGYQSDEPLDGRWHKLTVKVSRPGVTVRARRGYFATAAAPPMEANRSFATEKDRKKHRKGVPAVPVRPLDPALAVGGERDQIPLRIAPYVMETNPSGTTRLLVAVEVETDALTFNGRGSERTAQLDVTVLGVSRDHPTTSSTDSHVKLGVDADTLGGSWMFSRELHLPPGPAQVRVLVRDTTSGRSGLVAERVVIPGTGAPYISTPILTDRLMRVRGMARMVPAAHRTFRDHGTLYCVYEVYVAPAAKELKTIGQVAAGYTLATADGRVVDSSPPTPIAIALGGHFARTLAFPLDRLAPGWYILALQVEDVTRDLRLQTHAAFQVETADRQRSQRQ
jgi:VWFA-related protein